MPVYLYTDNVSDIIDIDLVINFLQGLNIKVENRGDLFEFLSLSDSQISEYNHLLEKSRVHNIEIPMDNLGEVFIDPGEQRELYDGAWIQRKLFNLFHTQVSDEINSRNLHLIISDRLIVTYGDKRYHARVVLMGTPSIISVKGLIEGPARPREYYFMKATYLQSGKTVDELDDMFDNRYLVSGDKRISKIISSYCLQPIFYHYLGQEFCDNSNCCLYNSHWQEEVINIHMNNMICEDCRNKVDTLGERIK